MKIAFIGAGSVGFTRQLMRDLLAVPEFCSTQFGFTDISERNLDMVTQLCAKDIRNNQLPAHITATTNRREALRDADYVVNCTRIGGLEAFAQDIEIPLKYGVDQCVGDTICVGGIMYGQRNIPEILSFGQDIQEMSKPGALLLNYANPMAMNVWAALEYGPVNTIGLCHGVQNGHAQIADVLGAGSTNEVDIICAGINHQTWYTQIRYAGRDIEGEELLALFEQHPVYSRTEKVRIDVLKRFGYYSTESNGHLSEYLPWYRKRSTEIADWIDLSSWIHGETGGYLRVCVEGRDWFDRDFPEWMAAEDPPINADGRSDEHASWILEGLETGREYRGHINVQNNGVIANLPNDCIVEVPGYFDKNGISIPRLGNLPTACAATCNVSVNVQRMAKEAAVHGDIALLKQAMLHDPLTAAVCNPEEIWQLADEMLVAQAKWLPQYTEEIPAARARLKEATLPTTINNGGAARLKTRTVEELRASGEQGRGTIQQRTRN